MLLPRRAPIVTSYEDFVRNDKVLFFLWALTTGWSEYLVCFQDGAWYGPLRRNISTLNMSVLPSKAVAVPGGTVQLVYEAVVVDNAKPKVLLDALTGSINPTLRYEKVSSG